MLFSFIWYPAALLVFSGIAYVLVSWLVREPLDIGIGFIILGSGLTLLCWLVTLGKRFTKKAPKPAADLIRVEWAIHSNPPVIKICWAAGALLAITTVVLPFVQSEDSSRDLIALSALFAVFFPGIAYGLSYAQRHLVAAKRLHQGDGPTSFPTEGHQ